MCYLYNWPFFFLDGKLNTIGIKDSGEKHQVSPEMDMLHCIPPSAYMKRGAGK